MVEVSKLLNAAEKLIDGDAYHFAGAAMAMALGVLIANPDETLLKKHYELHQRFWPSAVIDNFHSAKRAAIDGYADCAEYYLDEAAKYQLDSGLIIPTYEELNKDLENAQLHWHYALTQQELAALDEINSFSAEAEQLRALHNPNRGIQIPDCPGDCSDF